MINSLISYPIKAIRLIAGNAALARRVRSYLDQKEKITLSQWRTNVLPVLRNVENDILIKLRSYSLTDWQIGNLNNILGQVQNIISGFGTQFTQSVLMSQENISKLAIDSLNKEISLIGLATPFTPVISENIMAALSPMTEVFTEFFTSDLSKIVRSEITMGLVNMESASVVAKNIKDKFGNTSERIIKLNDKKAELQRQFDSGLISKDSFNKSIGNINAELSKGSKMSFARAETIARTELNRAANFSREIRGGEIMQANPDAKRIWINLHKPGARISHLAVERETRARPIGLDEPFNVGGYECQFPCDPALPPQESVNCGCTVVIVNPKDLSGL